MTRKDFRLPDLGEGLTESELVEWHVTVGDRVELNQTLADVETAKAVVQLPSPFAGTVAELYAEAGTTVEVGAPLIAFELDVAAGDAPEASAPSAPPAPSAPAGPPASAPDARPDSSADAASSTEPDSEPEPAAQRTSVLVGYGPAVETGRRPKRKPRSRRADAHPPLVAPRRGAALATPPVRKLAHDLGVDLLRIEGTGEHGAITRADVQAAADRVSGPGAGTEETSAPTETRTPIRGVRKATAEAMVRSAFTAPHVTEFFTVDVTRSTEVIARLKTSGQSASMLALASKAVCLGLARNPTLNSRWDEEAQEIVQYSGVNLGIAVATQRGLMVPTVRDAESKSLGAIADEIRELAETARGTGLAPEQLRGGTFSITNIGVFGIDAGTPILVPGEAAILALGAVRRLPWEYEGEVALRDVMTLSLSFDHRLVDGEQGARFLTDVGGILADPASVVALV